MKNKLLAIIAILMMLIGTFAFVFKPAHAVDSYKFLTVDYSPNPMLGGAVPDIAPPVGMHNFTLNSVINCTAEMYVTVSSDTQYKFHHWERYAEESNTTWVGTVGVNEVMVTMSENKTMTAFYTPQYTLTVITPYDVPNIWDSGVWYENVSSRWFDENDTAYAGVMKSNPNDWMTIGTWCRAYLVNFTGDASGKTYYPGYFWTSDLITMDGPKTAIAEWVVKYRLWTDPDSEYDPWGPGSGEYDPGKRGWYDDCTDVDLTAPIFDNENVGNWRWRFDYWLVERYNGTHWVQTIYTTENITVHLGPPTKATVYFQLQYYLTVSDSPSILDTGIESYTGYYDYCTNVTITTPAIVPDPSDPGIRWVFDHWWLASVFDVYNTTVTVHIEHATTVGKTLYAIYTKEYYLEVQDNVGDLSGVSSLSGWFAPGTVVPLSCPNIINIDTTSRYKFVEWVKDPGHFVATTPATTITMNSPRNATAFYKLQYVMHVEADPYALNAKPQLPGWPKDLWRDANKKYWTPIAASLIPDLPYDWYFDHFTVNGAPQTQYMNQIKINMTGPMNVIAHYLGKPAFFIVPQTVIVDAPAACTTFTVNVTAANLVDLYAMDFNVTWNPNYLELVDVDVEVNEIWTLFWIAHQEVDNVNGNFWFVATSLDGAPDNPYGFNGTNKIVALTFHIIYDPCYIAVDYEVHCDIDLIINQLADSNANQINPWNIHGGYYQINAIQPTLYLKPATVTVSQKDVVFTVELWIKDAVKLHDWSAYVFFDSAHMQIISIALDTTFLIGPYEMMYYWKSNLFNATHGIADMWVVQQQPGETLAYGEGRLATLTFRVNQTIFWTISNPLLHSWITIDTQYDSTWISVKCPFYEVIEPPLLLLEHCEYKYLPIPGDVNMDGIVDVLDLILVAQDMGTSTYDLDEDCDVDLIDLVYVAINFGRDEP
jgi:hypothetical protein